MNVWTDWVAPPLVVLAVLVCVASAVLAVRARHRADQAAARAVASAFRETTSGLADRRREER